MLRFILVTNGYNPLENHSWSEHWTIDGDLQALERALTSGGHGNGGYERTSLVGVEILSKEKNDG